MQSRESRQAVVIQAQMRGKGMWSDVTVRNISPHGMLLLAAAPPRPGDYIEVRKASLVLIGRAIWVKGKAFGIQLIERLNFNALLKAANESFAAIQSGIPPRAEPAIPARPVETLERAENPATQTVSWLVALFFLTLAILCAGAETLR